MFRTAPAARYLRVFCSSSDADTIYIVKKRKDPVTGRQAVSLFCLTRSEGEGSRTVQLSRLREVLGEFPLIVNTVPAMLLNREMLRAVRKDALILDLASKPGGDDVQDHTGSVHTDRRRKEVAQCPESRNGL